MGSFLKSSGKVICGCLLLAFFVGITRPAVAQSPSGTWSDFINISKTSTSSTYPCITSDSAGNIYVIWGEDVGGVTENYSVNTDGAFSLDSRGKPINYLVETGNTLFITIWNGKRWTLPLDFQTNLHGSIQYPTAVVDADGTLHVVWVSSIGEQTALEYSSAPVSKATSFSEWSPASELADSVLFADFPLDIAIDQAGGIHVIFSRTGLDPGVYITSSRDGGMSWSPPAQLFREFEAEISLTGVSNLRLLADKAGRLHATWTGFDQSGNGRALYYSQSTDNGLNWMAPYEVAVWQKGWYEVDWLNAGVTGNEIHLVWEGSSGIAAQVQRISQDGGKTWSEPAYILPKIVGENGFVDLVTDSADRMHLLMVKRGDPDSYTQGIWYSTWVNGTWIEPKLLGSEYSSLYFKKNEKTAEELATLMKGTFTGNGLRYQTAAILNGNQLHVVVVNEWDGDIWETHTQLDAPYIAPIPYPLAADETTKEETISIPAGETPLTTPDSLTFNPIQEKGIDPTLPVLFGIIPVGFLIFACIIYFKILKRN